MKLPIEVRMTRNAFISKFPFPTKNLSGASPQQIDEFEGVFRGWFGKLIQQIVFSHPNSNFVWKSSSPNNPPSKDFMGQTGGTFHGWDMFGGVGTGAPQLNDDPDSQDVPGQNPIPVTGVNYLNGTVVDPPIIIVPPTTGGQAEILERFDDTIKILKELIAEIKDQNLKLVQGLSDVKDAIGKGIKIRF